MRASEVSRRTGLAGLGATALAGLVLVALAVLAFEAAWLRVLATVAGIIVIAWSIDQAARRHLHTRHSPALWFARGWLLLVALCGLLATVLPLEDEYALPNDAPSYVRPDLFSDHVLGTDGFGRDYLARLIYGARVSLVVGVGGTLLALAIGTLIGVTAGYFRGRVDEVINILSDLVLAFPALVFLLALVSVLEPSLKTILIALIVLTTPTVIRLARANTYAVSEREFIIAARAMGSSHRRIIFRDILPIVFGPLLTYAMIISGNLIIAEASLSFLGLGIQAPRASWGSMIAESQNVLRYHPHTLLVPAVVLVVTVLSLNAIGGAVRTRSELREVAR